MISALLCLLYGFICGLLSWAWERRKINKFGKSLPTRTAEEETFKTGYLLAVSHMYLTPVPKPFKPYPESSP